MRAIQIGSGEGLNRLTLNEIEDPGDPGPGEVRVKIHASTLNFHDYGVCSGAMKTEDGRIPLADGAGIVEAVGPSVDELAPGDHVVSCFFPDWQDGPPPAADFSRTPGDGMDGFAREVVVAPARAFTRAPDGWSHLEAATITTAGLTAWRGLIEVGKMKPGDTVVTMGTGGVSILALQIAKAAGAEVISTSSSDRKLDRLREMGADHTVNYKTNEDWGDAVQDLTGGRGADIVIEVGGAATLSQSIPATRIGGHIALIGVLTGRAGEVPTALQMSRQITIGGFIVGSRAHQKAMVRAMNATGIRPHVDRSFPLADLPKAFRHEESGEHFGKIGITVGG